MLPLEVIPHVSTMTEIVAQGRIDFMAIQSVEAQCDLFGGRTLFEEGDDAFQSNPGPGDSDNAVSVFAQRRGFAFEGQLHCRVAQGLRVIRRLSVNPTRSHGILQHSWTARLLRRGNH